MVTALARSRASFLTSCNSLRNCWVSWTLAMIFSATSLVAVEEMQQLLAYGVDQLGADFRVAQFVLGLRLEDRVFDPNGHRADHAFAHVVPLEFALGNTRSPP